MSLDPRDLATSKTKLRQTSNPQLRQRYNGFDTAEEWAAAQDAFCACMAKITSTSQEEEFFKKIGDYATRIFSEASRCRERPAFPFASRGGDRRPVGVALEGYFVSTAIAIRVMEGESPAFFFFFPFRVLSAGPTRRLLGVANTLDPHVKIGQLAIPWILTSRFKRTKAAVGQTD